MGKKIVIVIGVFAAIVVAGLAFVWFSAGSGEPSAAVTAPTIATTVADSTATTTGDVAAAPNQVTFDIDKNRSSVQFELDELLDGAPNLVVGKTTEVAGQVLIDFDDPSASQLGTVVVNVRTLATGSEFRDRAIRGPILGSSNDANEFAEFAPTSIEGLPAAFGVGESVDLTINGAFTLSGVTNPVSFDVSVTLISDSEVAVTGSAIVLRSDYGLSIPSVARVAEVTNEVMLVIDFIAVAG